MKEQSGDVRFRSVFIWGKTALVKNEFGDVDLEGRILSEVGPEDGKVVILQRKLL